MNDKIRGCEGIKYVFSEMDIKRAETSENDYGWNDNTFNFTFFFLKYLNELYTRPTLSFVTCM